MRPTVDQWLMGMAKLTASRSTCCRRNVGAILVDAKNRILSTGYNGVAVGLPHCTGDDNLVSNKFACPGVAAESGTNLDGCYAIHAEQNALLQCQNVDLIAACYTTTSPCMTCTKLLLNTSCQRIIFDEDYPNNSAKDLWLFAGRKWGKINT